MQKSQVSLQSVDCSLSNVTECRPFVTDLSLNEYHLKRVFKVIFNFIKTIKKQWSVKHEVKQVHESSFRKAETYKALKEVEARIATLKKSID